MKGVQIGSPFDDHAVKLGDRDRVFGALDDFGRVTHLDLALLEHTHVEAHAIGLAEAGDESWVAHPDAEFEARLARRGDLDCGIPDAQDVSDAHLVVAEPCDRQVLAELAMLQRVSQLLDPPGVVVG